MAARRARLSVEHAATQRCAGCGRLGACPARWPEARDFSGDVARVAQTAFCSDDCLAAAALGMCGSRGQREAVARALQDRAALVARNEAAAGMHL